MKLSVIISCYSAEKMIQKCLSSLVNQTYKNIEIIVVDANSPDNTVEIIKNNFPQVILLEREHIGVGAALNEGLKIATGDIIVIDFNTDEYAEETWAEELVRAHQSYNFDVVISPTRLSSNSLVDGYGTKFIHTGGGRRIGRGSKYNPDRRPEECDFTGINTFPAKLIQEIGYVDEDYEFYGADTDFSLRARLASYKIMTEPKAVTRHQLSASKSSNYRKYICRMNFGILRCVFIHGTKMKIMQSLGLLVIYYNVKSFLKAVLLMSRRQIYYYSIEEIIGRLQGVIKIIRTFPIILKTRRKYYPKLIS